MLRAVLILVVLTACGSTASARGPTPEPVGSVREDAVADPKRMRFPVNGVGQVGPLRWACEPAACCPARRPGTAGRVGRPGTAAHPIFLTSLARTRA